MGTTQVDRPTRVDGYVDVEAVDRWTDEFPYPVQPDLVRAFAAATNDLDDPRHAEGTVAPPLFAVVASRLAVVAALSAAMPRGNPPRIQRLHGEHDLRLARPIVAGDLLWSRAALVGVQGRLSGVSLLFRIVTRGDDGSPVNEQDMLTYVPGLVLDAARGEERLSFRPAGDATARSPDATVELRTDPDQTFRYAPISGDLSRFHLDESYARSVGAPGIVLQGLCTMAFIARAVAAGCADRDATRLRRLGLRFSAPVRPGDTIATRLWSVGEERGVRVHALECLGPSGQQIARYGRAEVEA